MKGTRTRNRGHRSRNVRPGRSEERCPDAGYTGLMSTRTMRQVLHRYVLSGRPNRSLCPSDNSPVLHASCTWPIAGRFISLAMDESTTGSDKQFNLTYPSSVVPANFYAISVPEVHQRAGVPLPSSDLPSGRWDLTPSEPWMTPTTDTQFLGRSRLHRVDSERPPGITQHNEVLGHSQFYDIPNPSFLPSTGSIQSVDFDPGDSPWLSANTYSTSAQDNVAFTETHYHSGPGGDVNHSTTALRPLRSQRALPTTRNPLSDSDLGDSQMSSEVIRPRRSDPLKQKVRKRGVSMVKLSFSKGCRFE